MRQEDTSKLQDFVDSSKNKGAADEFVAALLTRRGWPAADVYAALGKYWELSTGLAIPERADAGESARDAFLYLLSFTTLATWTTAVGSMLFEFINHILREATHHPESLESGVRKWLTYIALLGTAPSFCPHSIIFLKFASVIACPTHCSAAIFPIRKRTPRSPGSAMTPMSCSPPDRAAKDGICSSPIRW